MKLERIRTDKFLELRGLGDSDIFESDIPADVAIFIGLNGCGKSILLEQIVSAGNNSVSPTINSIRQSMNSYNNPFVPMGIRCEFDAYDFSIVFRKSNSGVHQIHAAKTERTGTVLYLPVHRDVVTAGTRIQTIDFALQRPISVFDRGMMNDYERTLVSLSSREIQSKEHGFGPTPESSILDRIRRAFGIIFSEIELIGAYGHQFLARKNGSAFPIENLSNGEKQALILLSFIAKEPDLDDSIAIIDEPEIGLSPAIRMKFVASIRALSPSLQILIATHSKEVIESVDPANVIPLTELA